MPLILYIDTSANYCTVALSENGSVLSIQSLVVVNEHAAIVNNSIADVLNRSNKTFNSVDAIAVCSGPGSYTGLRVALSTAKGLAFALNKPLMLFNKLFLVALNDNKVQIKAIALKARKEEFFLAGYDSSMNNTFTPSHIFADKLNDALKHINPQIVITDDIENEIFEKYQTVLLSNQINIEKWLVFAEDRYAHQLFDDIAYSEPLYLKQAYTTTPKSK